MRGGGRTAALPFYPFPRLQAPATAPSPPLLSGSAARAPHQAAGGLRVCERGLELAQLPARRRAWVVQRPAVLIQRHRLDVPGS